MAKKRFFFGRDMTPDQMVDAIVKRAKENGIKVVDNRKMRIKKSKGEKPRT